MARVPLLVAIGLAGCGFHISSGNVTGGDGGPDSAIEIDAPPDTAVTDAADAAGDAPGDAPADSSADAPADAPISPKRRVKLTFTNGTRAINLDSFVALVVLDPTRVDYAAITAGGANLRFTDPNTTPLDYEIDEWTSGGTSTVWVRVPRIDASSDTDYIYMHYGDPALGDAQDPAGVWTGQSAVWHLAEDPGPGGLGDIKDSSPASRDGTATTAMTPTDLVPAAIGNGMHFAGSGGTGITAVQVTLPTYTYSMWIRGASAPVTGSNNKQPLSNGDVNFNFSWDHSTASFTGATAQRDAIVWHAIGPTTAFAALTWYYVAGTYDGTNLCIYRDGGAGVASMTPLPPNGPLKIGLESSGAASFNGWMDEVRIASGAVSQLRLDAEFANQRAVLVPANPFVVFSPPEVE